MIKAHLKSYPSVCTERDIDCLLMRRKSSIANKCIHFFFTKEIKKEEWEEEVGGGEEA